MVYSCKRKTRKTRKTRNCKNKKYIRKGKRKVLVGGDPFDTIIDITKTPDKIWDLKPGDHYTFFGYTIKFYDFNIPEHVIFKDKIKKNYNRKSCHQKIPIEYFEKAVDKSRFAIIITFLETVNYDKDYPEILDSFILANTGPYTIDSNLELTDEDLYVYLTCSIETYSNKKFEEKKTFPKDYKAGNIKTHFGIILRCLLLKYAKSIGIKNVYNDAGESHLIPYYTRFNFRLGKEKCDVFDEITNKHEQVISEKNEEKNKEFIDSLQEYKTSAGYRMKLCGNNYDALCKYSTDHLHEAWGQIGEYDDIYNAA